MPTFHKTSPGDPNEYFLKNRPPEVEQSIQSTLRDFANVLQDWHDSILTALTSLGIDLTSEGTIRMAVERQLNPFRDEWVTVIQNAWTDGAEAGRSAAIRRHSLDISYEIVDPDTTDAMREHGREAAEQVQERMTGDISEALAEAYEDGMGIPEMAQMLQDEVFPDMQGYEAERVARTESISAANRGRQSGFEDADVPYQRWMARDDSQTRHSHNEADNQVVEVGEQFEVGGHSARFPGDPSLPPGERINCRCIILPHYEAPE